MPHRERLLATVLLVAAVLLSAGQAAAAGPATLPAEAGGALAPHALRVGDVDARLQALVSDRRQGQTARQAARPSFKRDLLGNLVPHVRAAAAVIFDPQTGDVLWEENMHERRPIASLTKLMTAVTFLADDPDLSLEVTVASADVRRASVTYLRAGERVSHGELLHLALIASDNGAARVLARTSEGDTAAFVERMNEMATSLGLTNTQYSDSSGLSPENVSSAYDMSQMIAYASADPRLAAILKMPEYEATIGSRRVKVRSTNRLLGTEVDVVAGKTGFIRRAGYCLATLVQVPQGPKLAVVVLGAANSTTRFWEVRHLFNWLVERTQGATAGRRPFLSPSH